MTSPLRWRVGDVTVTRIAESGGASAPLFASGLAVYGLLRAVMGLRLSQEDEFAGADLSIHKIGATPDREVSW